MPDEKDAQDLVDDLVDDQVDTSAGENVSESDENVEDTEKAGLSPDDVSDEEKERRTEQSQRDKLTSLFTNEDDPKVQAMLASRGYQKVEPTGHDNAESGDAGGDDDAILTRKDLANFEKSLTAKLSREIGVISQQEETREAQGMLAEHLGKHQTNLTEDNMAELKKRVEILDDSRLTPMGAAILIKDAITAMSATNAMKILATNVEKKTADKVRKIKQGQTPTTTGAPPKTVEEEDPIIASLKRARSGATMFEEKA